MDLSFLLSELKPYVASIITVSRVLITIILLLYYRNTKTINYNLVIPLAAWGIASDKLDGIVARRLGSITIGGTLDFISDRICMIILFYLLIYYTYPNLIKKKNSKLLALVLLSATEFGMFIWFMLGMWPTEAQVTYHLGRISITTQTLATLGIIITRQYPNKLVETVSLYMLLAGTALTYITIILYSILYVLHVY